MSLLEELRTQEVVCRALQSQMGDIDSKMDCVTDQHIKTLGELKQSQMGDIDSKMHCVTNQHIKTLGELKQSQMGD